MTSQSNSTKSSSFGGKLESTAITTLNNNCTYTFNWRINNFHFLCPQDCDGFEALESPVFAVEDGIGNKTSWFMEISGESKYITCKLKLHSGTREAGGSGSKLESQDVKCSYKTSFGNEHNRFCFTQSVAIYRHNCFWYDRKFISIAELYANKETLLLNETLCICVQMNILWKPVTTHTCLPITCRRNAETIIKDEFVSDFHKLFNNKQHADVEITCGGQTFYAHKNVLSTRSTVFSAMFDSNMKESTTNQVHLTDIDADTIHCVLTYIYTGKVILTANISYKELIYGAEKYNLPLLKNYCFDRMLENVTNDTIGDLVVTAETYYAEPEYTKAVKKLCKEIAQ